MPGRRPASPASRSLRRAAEADAAAVADVHLRAWRAAYRDAMAGEHLDLPARYADRWPERLRAAEVWVAEEDGRVTGFGVAGPSRDADAPPGTSELQSLHVAPERWGRGTAAALHDHLLARLPAGRSTLWVFAANARARRFYERRGWELDGGERPEVLGLRVVRYARTLRPATTGILVAVTDHAAERYRQRVGSRTGALDVKPEVAGRVARAWAAGQAREHGGTVEVRDGRIAFVCRHDRRARELLVVTLWEEGEDARVPRHFTDVLKRT